MGDFGFGRRHGQHTVGIPAEPQEVAVASEAQEIAAATFVLLLHGGVSFGARLLLLDRGASAESQMGVAVPVQSHLASAKPKREQFIIIIYDCGEQFMPEEVLSGTTESDEVVVLVGPSGSGGSGEVLDVIFVIGVVLFLAASEPNDDNG